MLRSPKCKSLDKRSFILFYQSINKISNIYITRVNELDSFAIDPASEMAARGLVDPQITPRRRGSQWKVHEIPSSIECKPLAKNVASARM